MLPLPDDLIGDWTGLIVHGQGPAPVKVEIKGIQEDGFLYGSYSFPDSKPPEQGGEFTGELYGPWLFIRLEDHGKLRFHLHIIGKNVPEMMYGAISRVGGKTPHATITVFPSKEELTDQSIFSLWQIFKVKGL
jgi:hypothetical protein